MKKRLFMLGIFTMLFAFFGGITAAASENDDFPYQIQEGAVYYESSYDFGSGRYATVNSENEYAKVPCNAAINGYSFLDADGNILCCDYNEEECDIPIPDTPSDSTKLFVHFRTQEYRNGWTDYKNVSKVSSVDQEVTQAKEQKPEEVAKNIEVKTKEGKKTTIVIDDSGSMADNQREVVNLISDMTFDENTKVFIFADTYLEINPEQLSEPVDVGASTNLFYALSAAVSDNPEQVIIISDMQSTETNPDFPVNEHIENVFIYDPDFYMEDEIDRVKKTWLNADVEWVKIE